MVTTELHPAKVRVHEKDYETTVSIFFTLNADINNRGNPPHWTQLNVVCPQTHFACQTFLVDLRRSNPDLQFVVRKLTLRTERIITEETTDLEW